MYSTIPTTTATPSTSELLPMSTAIGKQNVENDLANNNYYVPTAMNQRLSNQQQLLHQRPNYPSTINNLSYTSPSYAVPISHSNSMNLPALHSNQYDSTHPLVTGKTSKLHPTIGYPTFQSNLESSNSNYNYQNKIPASPSVTSSTYYGHSNGDTTRRGSLIYPLTPVTMNSLQAHSPNHSSYDSLNMLQCSNYHMHTSNIKSRLNINHRPASEEIFGNQCSKTDDEESKQLYYEIATKEYVFRNKTDGARGVREGSLIEYKGVPKGDKNKGKKLSHSDQSEDESDSEKEEGYKQHEHDVNSSADAQKKDKKASESVKRSRTGCLTCRQRKKKCCETKPRCAECERLNISCRWARPGSERKNKSKKRQNLSNDEMYHEVYGVIKVLRGVVDYRVE